MGKTEKNSHVYSALEVAKICGVVNQTAINWIKNGYLKAFKTPGGQFRVYPEDLLDFMKKRSMKIPEGVFDSPEEKDTVLIVDDDRAFNSVLKQFIESKLPSVTVFQAFDGFEAGYSLERIKPSVLVLDIDLPGVNGFSLLEKICVSPDFGKPETIVVTGLEDEDLEEKCIKLSASCVLKKPVNFESFVEKLKELL